MLPQSPVTKVYDDPAKLLDDLARSYTGTRVRQPGDTVAPDGNTYTILAQTQGEAVLRERVRFLEGAIAEIQDTLAAVAKVMVDKGLTS